jgi:hypothetical protein
MRSAALEQHVADGHDLQRATSRSPSVGGREVVGQAQTVALGLAREREPLELAGRVGRVVDDERVAVRATGK